MSDEKKLKAGDTVRLKCGIGPIMMLETGEFGSMHTCIWFDKNNQLQSHNFPADFLKPVELDGRTGDREMDC